MKYGINIGKAVSALMVVVLTVSSAACGAVGSAGSSGDSGASNAKTAQSGDPFEKKDGVFTASEAFNTPSYWYDLRGEEDGIPTKGNEIENVLQFDGNGKVTIYSAYNLMSCGGQSLPTLADVKDVSMQEFAEQLKEAAEAGLVRCKAYIRDEIAPMERENAGCPGTKTYDSLTDEVKNLRDPNAEVCGDDYAEILERDTMDQYIDQPVTLDISFAIETDETGNNTAKEELQIGDRSYDLRPQPYPAAVYTKKYSGYDGLVTQTGENTSFQLDQPGTPGVKVDED